MAPASELWRVSAENCASHGTRSCASRQLAAFPLRTGAPNHKAFLRSDQARRAISGRQGKPLHASRCTATLLAPVIDLFALATAAALPSNQRKRRGVVQYLGWDHGRAEQGGPGAGGSPVPALRSYWRLNYRWSSVREQNAPQLGTHGCGGFPHPGSRMTALERLGGRRRGLTSG